MFSAKSLSEAIRAKRKKMKEDGVENMVDTHSRPQMDPNDILLAKQEAQWQETMGLPDKEEGPSDPADPSLDETQKESALKKRMARVARILGSLSVG